jgi:hypothetical protein
MEDIQRNPKPNRDMELLSPTWRKDNHKRQYHQAMGSLRRWAV